ncbi:hypothetical protein SDC9_86432 [bioreactor metagenome]|uniref:Gfo/Idh/MocA-like oxidoreductase C-terminal domain-containing protein n=1 Tax=bioreactor metagenome TaxID=1076179 RepID=A0A644ZGF2_9ZZZZ
MGQYLPDWHPWEDYTSYFIGDARTNGCRELLAIELPWLIQAFGTIDGIRAARRKLTTLNTAYDDCIFLLINHKNGTIGSVCVDVVSRKAVREFEMIGEDIYLSWNGTPDSLRLFDLEKRQDVVVQPSDDIDRQEGYAAFVIENAYASELKAFIEAVNGGTAPKYDFAEDMETLRLIDEVESQK